MKGLFKSNFLAVWTNAKIFLLFMFAMGIAVIIIPSINTSIEIDTYWFL